MSLPLSPLEPSQLSSEAQRALSTGPSRMMAARGMAPLSSPADLVSVLYQLSLDGETAVREAAVASSRELPLRVVRAALADTSLDPRVLDFFSRQLVGKADALEAVILNSRTADETIAWIASRGGAREVDIIAGNEQRLLRHPEIIAALYTNRAARMSTVDRVVELAVHNSVKVPDIAAWDEICRSILQSGKGGAGEEEAAAVSDEEKDAIFAAAAAVHASRDDSDDDSDGEGVAEVAAQPRGVRDLTVPMKIRLATLGNKFDRGVLVRDTKKMVALAAIKSPGVTDSEAAKYATNSSLAEEVIAYIASRREWVKLYGTKMALVQNPKTPLPAAMRLMTHLRDKDVRGIARSKSVPSALSAQARKLSSQRSKSGK